MNLQISLQAEETKTADFQRALDDAKEKGLTMSPNQSAGQLQALSSSVDSLR